MSFSPLKIYLSGGVGNTDPNASIGGDKSTTEPSSQTIAWETATAPAVDFLTIDYCFGLYAGGGVDDKTTYYHALEIANDTVDCTVTLWSRVDSGESWVDSGNIVFAIGDDGQYTINTSTGVETDIAGVVFTYDSTMADKATDHDFFVTNPTANMFTDISSADSQAGKIDYRWIYYSNTGAVSIDLNTYLPAQTAPDSYEIGFNTTGVNDAPPLLTNEITAPAGGDITFSNPLIGSPLTITLAAGDYIALCIKRTIPASNITAKKPSLLSIITSFS